MQFTKNQIFSNSNGKNYQIEDLFIDRWGFTNAVLRRLKDENDTHKQWVVAINLQEKSWGQGHYYDSWWGREEDEQLAREEAYEDFRNLKREFGPVDEYDKILSRFDVSKAGIYNVGYENIYGHPDETQIDSEGAEDFCELLESLMKELDLADFADVEYVDKVEDDE